VEEGNNIFRDSVNLPGEMEKNALVRILLKNLVMMILVHNKKKLNLQRH
jgi:hypothetical protein